MGKRKQKQTADTKRKAGCSLWVWLVAGVMFILYSIGNANPSSRQSANASAGTRPTEVVMVNSNSTASPTKTQTLGATATLDAAVRLAEEIAQIEGMVSAQAHMGVIVYIEGVAYPGFVNEETADAIRAIIAAADHDTDEMTVILTDGVLPIDFTWTKEAWRITELRQIATANATMFGTPTPLPTRTPTAAATATSTPASAARETDITIYTSGSTRMRSCANTTCEIVATIDGGEALKAVATEEGQAVNAGNSTWYKVEYNGQTGYVYSGVVSLSAQAAPAVVNPPASGGTVPVATQAASGGGNTTRPGNCSTAVAMGLSPEEAAKWPHLDRDKDGVACYGD